MRSRTLGRTRIDIREFFLKYFYVHLSPMDFLVTAMTQRNDIAYLRRAAELIIHSMMPLRMVSAAADLTRSQIPHTTLTLCISVS